MRILIADDHHIVRRGIRDLLDTEPDMTIVGEASNGEEAVTAVANLNPDVVLMDLVMPGTDGIEATRHIRELEGAPAKTPIVALTANAMASDRRKCVAAGMDDFLTKPFEPAEFHAMLEKWRPAPARAAAS